MNRLLCLFGHQYMYVGVMGKNGTRYHCYRCERCGKQMIKEVLL